MTIVKEEKKTANFVYLFLNVIILIIKEARMVEEVADLLAYYVDVDLTLLTMAVEACITDSHAEKLPTVVVLPSQASVLTHLLSHHLVVSLPEILLVDLLKQIPIALKNDIKIGKEKSSEVQRLQTFLSDHK